MSPFELLIWPFLCCLVLTGIHAYLGLHVVERGVIFVDLSLAQIAALGSTIGFLAGYDLHTQASYYFSLGFTILGAILFSFARFEKSRIPQEAFIGIVYAVSSAAAILIVDRAPEGAEHIKYILVGNLLSVSPEEVLKMAGLYSFIGFLHWRWRKPLLTISISPQKAIDEGYLIRFWDFAFYVTFGFVVTSSVEVAGVLLVFSFLIVPSVIAMFFSDRLGMRLLIGWVVGTLVSLLGMVASYYLDMPTGATVVVTFGFVLLFSILLKILIPRQKIV